MGAEIKSIRAAFLAHRCSESSTKTELREREKKKQMKREKKEEEGHQREIKCTK